MSDSSLLYFLNRRERPRRRELEEIDSPFLLADWHLPIGWLAMFAPTDLYIDSSSIHDRDKPYFAVECGTAVARLDERVLWLKSAVPGLQTAWLDSFRHFVSNANLGWVHMDPVAISTTIGDNSVPEAERLVGLLYAFEQTPTPLDAVTELNIDIRDAWKTYSAHFGTPFRDSSYDLWFACFGTSGTEFLAPWESAS